MATLPMCFSIYPKNWRTSPKLNAHDTPIAGPGGGVMPEACLRHDDARRLWRC